jgi:hypothetical protein
MKRATDVGMSDAVDHERDDRASTRRSNAKEDSNSTSSATSTAAADAAPIPGHPPVTMTGVVASFDPASGVLTFKDGRIVKLTGQSKVLKPAETTTVRPGEQVIVRNALPVGVQSAKASTSGKKQRMATVASVDEPNQIVR